MTSAHTTGSTSTFLRRARTLAALGAASLALVAASPASAETKRPTDKNGKQSCIVNRTDDGVGEYVPHGTVRTRKLPDGSTETATCNDGTWEPNAKTIYAGGIKTTHAVSYKGSIYYYSNAPTH
jgi:hypothetical protein